MQPLSAQYFRFGEYELDGTKRLLLRRGKTVSLNSKTFDLLLALVENRGEVLGREQLLETVWKGQFVEEGNLTVHVSALRKAFGERRDEHKFIVTVPGRGYSFVAKVEEPNEEIVVESHRSSTIVIEENENELTEPDTPQIQNGRPRAVNLLAVAGSLLLVIGALGSSYWLIRDGSVGPPTIESVAVLPFINDSGNAELEYLSDGLAESLINSLSHLPKVSVKPRATVERYKNKDIHPQQVGAELKVHGVLTGRVVERGDRLSLYVSLIDTRNGNQVWGEHYDRDRSELVQLQGAVARDVSSKLRSKLSAGDEQSIQKTYTADPEAYILYLKGRYHLNKRSPNEMRKAIDFFEQATRRDPNYALAFAGLADSYSLLSNYGGSLPHETKPKARTAALRALAIDESLAEAHTALGGILGDYDHDFAGEEREYKRAIELNPNLSTAHHWYGELLSRSGRHEEAAAEYQKALEIDPLSLIINRSFAESFYYARKYDECLAQIAKLQEMEPGFGPVHHSLAMVNNAKGEHRAAVEGFANFEERMLGQKQFADQMRQSFERGGWNEFLREMTGPRRPSNLPYYLLALFHAALGENDKAFANLELAFDRREPFILSLKVDPLLDPLRSDPRFTELLKRIGP